MSVQEGLATGRPVQSTPLSLTGSIRVVVADEHSLFREAICLGLGRDSRLDVVGEARDGAEAIATVKGEEADVAILHADLPNGDGVRVTAKLADQAPGCRVLILSDQEDLRTLIDALEAGARGLVTKDRPLTELTDAVLAAHLGEYVVPQSMIGPLLDRLLVRRREQDEAGRLLAKLSKRERQLLALLADGADNDVIAQRLVISPQTARTHVQNVLSKLELHSRLQAAAFARQNGLLDELRTSELDERGSARIAQVP